ncbi:hypothetical protein KC19_2G206400 [Ceratodon purpureus]|uniref:Secreted protein n=1 Tax=Ceratodon purpureus TaxID=3225 RepID=A0A8T0IZ17_CERPU|nr:hypothetical protein KC19_2G206400 [Ceratodon purpureus]
MVDFSACRAVCLVFFCLFRSSGKQELLNSRAQAPWQWPENRRTVSTNALLFKSSHFPFGFAP